MLFVQTLRSQRSLFPYRKRHTMNLKLETLAALSQSLLSCSTNPRSISASALSEEQGEGGNASGKIGSSVGTSAKPYDVVFKEAVGLIERSGDSERRTEGEGGGGGELGKKLSELEMELKVLTGKSDGTDGKLEWRLRKWWRRKEMGLGTARFEERERVLEGVRESSHGDVVSSGDSAVLDGKPRSKNKGEKRVVGNEGGNSLTSLSAFFGRKGVRKERALEGREQVLGNDIAKGINQKGIFVEKDRILREREDLIVKDLSPDMKALVRHLYDEGYFRDANFLPGNKFDMSSFESPFALNYLKFAAERFGRDKQEIAKWLSGSDLKQVALFGCPSLAKRNVFAAKSLRTFFQIPEDTVCKGCYLRESCKFVNQSIWNKNSKNLNLSTVMRLLTVCALEAVPARLVLSDDIKACVSRLMKDVINLSKTVP